MRKFLWAFLFLPFILFISATPANSGSKTWNIVHEMFETAKEVKSMSYVMTRKERVEDEIKTGKTLIKVQVSPYRAYLKRLGDDGGLEVIYSDGQNGNKMLINPNGFPWINLSISPLNTRVRKGNHHTILDNGYKRLVGYLENQLILFEDKFDEISSMEDNRMMCGASCWKVKLKNPDYSIITHTVVKGETVQQIADHYLVNAYRILELNESVDDYDGLKAGLKIKIPSHYCKVAIIHINKNSLLPQSIEIHDDQGFYESYTYEQVKINPDFSDADFSSENPDYGF